MKPKFLRSSVVMAALVGVCACDFSPDALIGKKAEHPDWNAYYEQHYQSSSCERTVKTKSSGCFFEDLDEIVQEVDELSKVDFESGRASADVPTGMRLQGGLRIITKSTRDKRKVEVSSMTYRKTSGAAYERQLICKPSKFDPQAEGFHATDCAFVDPGLDYASYRLVSFSLKAGNCENVYQVTELGSSCSTYSSQDTVDIGGGRAPILNATKY